MDTGRHNTYLLRGLNYVLFLSLFSVQARTLVRTVVNPEMKKEMKHNQDLFSTSLNIQPQDTAIFINGMFFDLDVVDMISLLEIIRQEQRLMQGLHTIGTVQSHQ